ncbi:electron transport complex subunit RsxB [Arhodomonas sp. AD133]|uniref:electron transport complex subunit RsxB n=1 Tax=Arhodomonas sp. AD133 TaxID=3415009 RepID=UPI003EC0C91E
MIEAIAVLGGLGIVLGGTLGFAAVRFKTDEDPLVERIDAVLPQTQCGQCGFPGCRPYAEAIARDEADINQCPPGGEAGVEALAELLGREPKPINPENGEAKTEPTVAWIDEDVCIGCTKCIQACPVDAIVGAPQLMHTVIRGECTGCELCIEPCPVDCIHMETVDTDLTTWHWPLPDNRPEARRA